MRSMRLSLFGCVLLAMYAGDVKAQQCVNGQCFRTPVRTVIASRPVLSAIHGVADSIANVKASQECGQVGCTTVTYAVGCRDHDGAIIVSVEPIPAGQGSCNCSCSCPCQTAVTNGCSGGVTTMSMSMSVQVQGGSSADVGVGTVAYQFCLREATEQARRRRMGHLFGVAPGARMQGVGSSHSGREPRHCEGRGLIARAGVQGPDGRWYWSAAYVN